MKQTMMSMKVNNTPEKFSEMLREMGDIFWWPGGKFWVITAYSHAKSILLSDDFTCDRSSFFVSRMPEMDLQLIQDFFGVVGKMMVMSDPPQHTARRRICYNGFTQQTLENLQPLLEKTIQKQITHCAEKGEIELVEDIAKIIPSTILADFFNIPESERNDFYHWSNNMTQFFGGSSSYQNADGIEVNNSAKALKNYFESLMQERRKNPKEDFLSILLTHQATFALTDEEIVSQAIMMLVAGQVTTTDQFCNNMYTLLSAQKNKEALLEQTPDIEVALDELNRLDPAVTFIFRVTKRDTLIGKQPIKAGDVIFISTHAVNRDPTVFENPNACNFLRKSNREISYGLGGHYCLGAKLARIEMKNCLSQLLARFPTLRLSPHELAIRKHHSLSFSGFERLPLVFT